jgi:WD40 repeat protein
MRFVRQNRSILDVAPLQIYPFPIALAPERSTIPDNFDRIPRWILRLPKVSLMWSLEPQKLEGHTPSRLRRWHFFLTARLLASPSTGQTVRLWNTTTGEEVQKLEAHTSSVKAVAFSPDSRLLVSASGDWTVTVWNITTAEGMRKLEGHAPP